MTDQEWARAFVRSKIKGTGIRLGETVDVLVKKLAQVREEATAEFRSAGTKGEHRGSPRLLQEQGPSRSDAGVEG